MSSPALVRKKSPLPFRPVLGHRLVAPEWDLGQQSSNRLSRNALSAGFPSAVGPRARSLRQNPTPSSTTEVPGRSNSALRCSIRLPSRWPRRRRSLLRSDPLSDRPGDRGRPPGSIWRSRLARRHINVQGLDGHERLPRERPIIADGAREIIAAFQGAPALKSTPEGVYSQNGQYSHSEFAVATPRKSPAHSSDSWTVADAKARLSEVIERAQTDPQIITRHGKPSAVARVGRGMGAQDGS